MQELNSQEILSRKLKISLKNKARLREKTVSKVNHFVMKKKRFWTEAEDRILEMGVQKFGNKKWSDISKLLKNRHPKRCRERWFNYLTEKNKIWTSQDLWLLFLAYKIHGNRWCQISKILERGDNIVKNKIICLKRKGMNEFEQRLSRIFENQWINNSQSPVESQLLKKLIKQQDTQKGKKTNDQEVIGVNGQKSEKDVEMVRQKYDLWMQSLIPVQTYQIQYQHDSFYPGMVYYGVPFYMGVFS